MSRLKLFLLLASILLVGSAYTFAGTYAVGTCKPSLQSFSTIATAVESVPAYSTVFVCPGTYPEQFLIGAPMTLKGVSTGNSDQVVITVPPTGLTNNVISYAAQSAILPAQIGVITAGVNISNIIVDGANNNVPGSYFAGIFYQAGSSGIVSSVTTRNQAISKAGVGVWVENFETAGVTPQTVTIQSSSIHDADAGVLAFGGVNLTANIKNNMIQATNTAITTDAAGLITGNVASAPTYGIFTSGSATISSNTISNASNGIFVENNGSTISSVSITGNKIFHSVAGIRLIGTDIAVKSNIISDSTVGIALNCSITNTAVQNQINESSTGLNGVPAGFTGSNTFLNVGTTKAGC